MATGLLSNLPDARRIPGPTGPWHHASSDVVPQRAKRAAPGAGVGHASRPGLLVVDDDESIRTLLRVALHQSGFTVWAAASAAEAVTLFRQHRDDIDAVLLDVRMPGTDGPQTLALLQKLRPGVRCCFMSGHIGAYTEQDLLERGAVRVIAKPFHLAELRSYLWQLATQAERRGA